jgi:predicted DNA-binding transcriptional regulator AlpA
MYMGYSVEKGRWNMEQDLDELLDRKTAAKYLKISPGTLAVWDCTKRYELNPLKVGRSVRYRKSELDNFISRKLVK